MKHLELSKKIDTFVFEKIDELQNQPEYQKIADSYSNLDENIQELIKTGLMALITVIPLIIFLYILNSNSSLKKEFTTKENVINVANELIQKKSIITNKERKILGTSFINSESALKNKITSLFSMSSIDTTKIKINNFNSEELDDFITKVKSDIKFRDITSQELYAMLNTMTARGKMRVEEVSIRKSSSDNLLDGMLTIHYYSKEMTN